MKYVAYYRVSTKIQSLGIDAQKTTIRNFLKKDDEVLKEFIEKESGKIDSRVELDKAIKLCKEKNAVLLIAKLDRLSRNVTFISALMDSKLEFICCDLPSATPFTLHIFAALAQQEREMISSRTKAALSELKAKGVKLGKPANLTDDARAKGRTAVSANALQANKQVIEMIGIYRDKGLTYAAISEKLNELGYTTRYNKSFSKSTVKILYDRYCLTPATA